MVLHFFYYRRAHFSDFGEQPRALLFSLFSRTNTFTIIHDAKTYRQHSGFLLASFTVQQSLELYLLTYIHDKPCQSFLAAKLSMAKRGRLG